MGEGAMEGAFAVGDGESSAHAVGFFVAATLALQALDPIGGWVGSFQSPVWSP
jgi:hypothetical protein